MARQPFTYQSRDVTDWQKRASGSGDFQGFIKDEYEIYEVRNGDNYIRILPPTWDKPRHYGLDIYVHYQLGPERASALCLAKMQNKRCPICEAQLEADRAGDEQLKKDLRAAHRVLVWMLDRKEEDKGPLLWAMPATQVDVAISAQCRDPDTGEIYEVDHPTRGYNISFTREGKGLGTRYGAPQLSRKATSVSQEYLDYIQDHPLPDVLNWRTYEEILRLYQGPTDDDANAPPPRTSRRSEDRGGERERDERDTRGERDTRSDRRPDDRGSDRQERSRPAERGRDSERQSGGGGWTRPDRGGRTADPRAAAPAADPVDDDTYADGPNGYDNDPPPADEPPVRTTRRRPDDRRDDDATAADPAPVTRAAGLRESFQRRAERR